METLKLQSKAIGKTRSRSKFNWANKTCNVAHIHTIEAPFKCWCGFHCCFSWYFMCLTSMIVARYYFRNGIWNSILNSNFLLWFFQFSFNIMIFLLPSAITIQTEIHQIIIEFHHLKYIYLIFQVLAHVTLLICVFIIVE